MRRQRGARGTDSEGGPGTAVDMPAALHRRHPICCVRVI
jgi:hypothetical protein